MTALASPAFAGDLRGSMKKSVAESVQAVAPKPAPAENPYKMASIALIVGGGAIAVYGFTHATGAELSSNNTGTSISAKETHNTGLGLLGVGAAGLGAVLFAVGQKQVHPEVGFGRRGAYLGAKWHW